jgi:hypothetical protein
MFATYSAVALDGSRVVSACSPESLGEFLGRQEEWPPGCYDVTGFGAIFDFRREHWGVAIKHADGSVELVPDPA